MTKKYANSMWTEYSLDDVEVETEELRHRTYSDTLVHNLITKTGEKFYTLSALYTKEVYPEPMPPIILDENELKLTKAHMRKTKMKRLADVIMYLRSLPEKKIYMRTVCPTKCWQRRQVFTRDAIEVIELLLKKLQIKVKKFEIRMEKLRKRWENNDDVSRVNFTTISVFQFQEALDDFDIDKSLITLVPDIFFVYQVKYLCHVSTQPGVITLGPFGDEWVDAHQAILMLFQDIVVEVNWLEDVDCKKHENCTKVHFRQRILDLMRNYEQYGDWSCLKMREVMNDISALKKTCNYRLRERMSFTPGLELLFCDFSDQISIEYFVKKCNEYRFLPPKFDSLPHLDCVFMPAWKARVIFMFLWTDFFFNDFYPRLKSIVIDAIAFKIPFLHWTEELHPLDVILSSDDDVLEQEYLTAEKNAVDLTEHAKEMRSTLGEYTTFIHPWMHGEVVDRWLCDPNIHRCEKWALRESTYEVRNGRSSRKSPARIEKLIEEYLVRAKKEFEMNKENEMEMTRIANGILRNILLKPEVVEKNDERLETIIEETEEAICDNELEKETEKESPEEEAVPDYVKLSNNLEVLTDRLFWCKKRGMNQWRHIRHIRNILQDSVIRHYQEMLMHKNEAIEKHEKLIQKHEELLEIVKAARKGSRIKCDPSEPSTSTAEFVES